MNLGRPWILGVLAVLGGCVAASEGPTETGGPREVDPGLRADLFAGPIDVPGEIRVDSILEMLIGVRNGGTRQAEPGWVVRVVLSRDQVIDSADIEIDHFSAPRALAPGMQDDYLRHKKLRGSTPLGLYYVGSILDVTGKVAESSEANNALRFPTPIVLTAKVPRPSGDQ
jgi:CARDB